MKITPKHWSLIFSLLLVFAIGASGERVYGQTCSSTPEAIVASVYTQIAGNKSLADQVNHINVQFTNYDQNGNNGAIRLQGWVRSQSDYDKVYEYAMEANCVTRVNTQEFSNAEPTDLKGACSPPVTKPCGDICIPGGDTCNIGGNTKAGD